MRTTFESKGETVVADLELPEAGGPFPAAVLLGPLTSVKEQATGNYARALARKGWAALSFDPRYFGESSGSALIDPAVDLLDRELRARLP